MPEVDSVASSALQGQRLGVSHPEARLGSRCARICNTCDVPLAPSHDLEPWILKCYIRWTFEPDHLEPGLRTTNTSRSLRGAKRACLADECPSMKNVGHGVHRSHATHSRGTLDSLAVRTGMGLWATARLYMPQAGDTRPLAISYVDHIAHPIRIPLARTLLLPEQWRRYLGEPYRDEYLS